LDEGREGHKPLARIDDLPLFATGPNSRSPVEPRISAVEADLRAVDPDSLTPKSALELLYALKRKLAEGQS
jgi:DNA mismatch repair protein MutS